MGVECGQVYNVTLRDIVSSFTLAAENWCAAARP